MGPHAQHYNDCMQRVRGGHVAVVLNLLEGTPPQVRQAVDFEILYEQSLELRASVILL